MCGEDCKKWEDDHEVAFNWREVISDDKGVKNECVDNNCPDFFVFCLESEEKKQGSYPEECMCVLEQA